MLNVGDNADGFQRPCEIDEVTVDTDFDGYTINVRAEMLIPPRAQINIGTSLKHFDEATFQCYLLAFYLMIEITD